MNRHLNDKYTVPLTRDYVLSKNKKTVNIQFESYFTT